ncbi:hypothetical protein PG987_014788 [Apiospora arundinis]
MSWLFEFPLELLLEILSYIDSGQEWKSLATVNRGFYNLAISRFWDGIDDDQKCRIFFWACAAGSTRAVNRLLELGVTVNLNLQVGYSNGLEDQDPRYYIGLPNSHIPQNGMGGYAFLPDMNDIILLDGLYYLSSCKPLHVAVSHGQKHIVEILLRHGVWIDAPSKDYCSCSDRPLSPLYRQYQPRFTALHVAICTHQEDIAQMLISNGASIYVDRVVHKLPRTDHPDHSRVTALHYCAIHDSLSTAKLMIEEGYESAINEFDEYGWSPIMYAYTNFSDSVFDFLLAKGASTQIERGEETVLNYLDSGGRYNMAFEEDKMALCEACRYSCVRLAKRLLDLGADANQLVSDYKDEQMYWTVCSTWENGNVAVLCLLLERGGNPFRSEGESGIGFPFENCLLGNPSLEFYRELCRRTINADTNDDDLFDVVDTVCSSGRYAFLQEMRSCDGRVDTLIREKGALFLQKLLVNLSPIGENFHRWEHFKEIDEVIDTLGLILRLGGYKQLTSGWRLKKGRDNFTALIILKKLLLPPVNPEPPLGLPSLRAYERHYCDRDYLQLSKIYLCLNSRIKIGSESSKNSVKILGRKALGSSEIKEIEERGDIHFTTLDAKSFDDIYICICETPRWGDY